MIKVNVVAVGKVKEDYFKKAIEEYSKRLKRFCEFKIIEVNEENSKSEIELIKQKEAENILPHLKGKVIVLAIEGKKISSEALAKKISDIASFNQGTVTFVIGGSYGVSDKIKNTADELVSFSDMTFPHTLFRVLLTEQIYRAFTILNGVNYHK